jgi:hypothetical protein
VATRMGDSGQPGRYQDMKFGKADSPYRQRPATLIKLEVVYTLSNTLVTPW